MPENPSASRRSVSVVLPVHNAAATLDECLDSIQAQTLQDFSLLAIDDQSSDDSRARLERRAAADPRIRVLVNPRAGLVNALNLGYSVCSTEYVARMDADDRMRRDRLRLQVEYLAQHPGIAAVGSRVQVFPAAQIGPGCREYIRWQDQCMGTRRIADERYREAPIANPSAMFRSRVVQELGGYRDGDFPEDYEFWLRLHAGGQQVAKLDRVLLDWRVDPGSHSRTHPRYARDAFDRLRSEYLARDQRVCGERPVVFWGAGRKTRKRSRLLIEQGVQPRAYVDVDPNKIGNRLNNIPVLEPGRLADWQPKPFVLNYVVNHGAPELIEQDLGRLGYRRGEDFLHVG